MRKKDFEEFWIINENAPLGANAIALYFFLLHHWEKNKHHEFSISEYEISKKLKISRPTISMARKVLVAVNLISCTAIKGHPTLFSIKNSIDLLKQNNVEFSKIEISEPNRSYPTFEEFMEYAKTLVGYSDSHVDVIRKQYEKYGNNNWKGKLGEEIDWRKSFKMQFPFLLYQKK